MDAEHVNRHMLDFGFQRFFPSHHPLIVPEPYTPEPTESYSKADIDEYVAALKKISDEAYSTPEVVLTAPHNDPISALKMIILKPCNQPGGYMAVLSEAAWQTVRR